MIVYIAWARAHSLWYFVHPEQLSSLRAQSELLLSELAEENVTAYLHAGTLLNAVRDGGDKQKMAWEYDEDICVALDGKATFEAIVKEMKWKYQVYFHENRQFARIFSDHSYFADAAEIHIDVLFGNQGGCRSSILNKKLVESIPYGTVMANIPHDAEQWLSTKYGADWRISKETDRGVKEFQRWIFSSNSFWFSSNTAFFVFYLFIGIYTTTLWAVNLESRRITIIACFAMVICMAIISTFLPF